MDKAKGKPQRRDDIDWLRVLGMLAVFFFHCARFFNDEGWHAKSGEISYGMTVFVGVLNQWMMPLFFVLSGISSYYALSYISGKKYLDLRIKRLVVPLVFGIFTHVVLQIYIERVTTGEFTGSFFAFYQHYFDGFYAFGGNFAWMGLHLWYLEMLFVFSLITLPLFLWTRKKSAKNLIAGLAGFLKKPGAIFLIAVPLSVVILLSNLDPDGIGNRSWGSWAMFPHLTFFLSGYLLASTPEFRPTLERNRFAALALGVMATTAGFILLEYVGISSRGHFFSFLRAFNSWACLFAILGFGSKHLNFSNRFLKYAGEAVLPFYILHQSVIIVIGYFIIHWTAAVMLQYLFLASASFAAIMAIYELSVRRINVMRFLFGLKQRKREPAYVQQMQSDAGST
jgi:peptidoglycan/LPS O-acetylase OafA/YrhL